MSKTDAAWIYIVRLQLIAALLAGAALTPFLLPQAAANKRPAEVQEASSEYAAPPQVAAVVKKIGKPLRLLKKLLSSGASGRTWARDIPLYAAAAVMLYPCVRLLLRRAMLMPIKFTSAYVVPLVR